ncbi:MAG: efflux RND transporter periplasmic adaptor subunit [Isosphaeraceae bacterium]
MMNAKTAAVVAAGLMTTLSVATFAQNGPDRAPAANRAANVLVLDDTGTIDWIEKSAVAALREGVIEKMELGLGDVVLKGKPIGYLHREAADLTVAKSKVMADSTGAIEKGEAAKGVALSVVARNKRLNERKPGMVSAEEVAKAEGELNLAEAQIKEAQETREVNRAEMRLAEQILKEHTIVAPFEGVVIRRMKHPGERVGANEAVVEIGNLTRLCANAYVPVKHALKVKEGQVVELRPKTDSFDGGEELANLVVRGRITFVDPQIQAVAELSRRIRVEFENTDLKMFPGLKVQMTIFLNDAVAARIPPPAAR